MKHAIRIVLWIGIVLSTTVKGQQNTNSLLQGEKSKNRDTVMIIPDADTRILILGDGMKTLIKNTSLDSLKNLMITDVEQAHKQSSYPVMARVTHYFVSPNGKRRLKAESEDFAEPAINIEEEKRALLLDLPPYEFIIYAIAENYECRIYLKDPENLSRLMAVNLNESLASAMDEKKIIQQSTRIDIGKEQSHWKIQNHQGNKTDLLEWTPSFGMNLTGGRWSPVLGFDLSLIFNDKFSSPLIKTGLSYNFSTFAEWKNNDISALSGIASYNIRFLTNMAGAKPKWIGVQGGYMKEYIRQGSLDKKFSFGIVSEGFSVFNFSFNVIFLKKKESVYSLTLMLPF